MAEGKPFALSGRQAKGRSIVGSRKPSIEPAEELGDRPHHRYALVINRGQDHPTDEDLASRVELPFGMTGACDAVILLRPQTGEAFIEGLNSGENFFGLRHGSPPTTTA